MDLYGLRGESWDHMPSAVASPAHCAYELVADLSSTTMHFWPAPYSAYTPMTPHLSKVVELALEIAAEKPPPTPT